MKQRDSFDDLLKDRFEDWEPVAGAAISWGSIRSGLQVNPAKIGLWASLKSGFASWIYKILIPFLIVSGSVLFWWTSQSYDENMLRESTKRFDTPITNSSLSLNSLNREDCENEEEICYPSQSISNKEVANTQPERPVAGIKNQQANMRSYGNRILMAPNLQRYGVVFSPNKVGKPNILRHSPFLSGIIPQEEMIKLDFGLNTELFSSHNFIKTNGTTTVHGPSPVSLSRLGYAIQLKAQYAITDRFRVMLAGDYRQTNFTIDFSKEELDDNGETSRNQDLLAFSHQFIGASAGFSYALFQKKRLTHVVSSSFSMLKSINKEQLPDYSFKTTRLRLIKLNYDVEYRLNSRFRLNFGPTYGVSLNRLHKSEFSFRTSTIGLRAGITGIF
ncbi:MAG: hypothetical protein ABJ004_03130 [Cyclobacteriaceae bacterium]